MAAAFSMLFAKIAAVVQWFGKLFIGVFKSLWDMLTDVPCLLLEQALDIVISAVSAFNFDGVTGSLSAFNDLPAEMVNILGLLGFAEAMGIIGTALTIRILMQLVPFTRLGS